MNHTPTPWKVSSLGDEFEVVSSDEKIGICLMYHEGKYKKNAEFIVTACNAWDNLEALEARIKELRGNR